MDPRQRTICVSAQLPCRPANQTRISCWMAIGLVSWPRHLVFRLLAHGLGIRQESQRSCMNLRAFIGAASLVAAAMANASTEGSSDQASASQDQSSVAATAADAHLATAPGGGFIFLPTGPDQGQQRWAVGGVWQVAPMFAANFRLGLGSGLGFDARATTILVYNSLGAGVTWAIPVGPFHLGLMAHVDAWF